MEKQHLLNQHIKSSRVLLLTMEGEKIGEMSLQEALRKATEEERDLMQVGQNKDIAICKIINYESWLYHENKKKQKQEFKNRAHELKNMNFRPVTGDNDFNIKIRKIEEFLEDNHKVKIIIRLKNREGSMKAVNEAFIQKLINALGEKASMDSKINWTFKEINFILKPEKKLAAKPKM